MYSHVSCKLYCLYHLCCFSYLDRTFDKRCTSSRQCWYCKNRCSRCLQPAAFGLTFPSSKLPEEMLKFCSTSCKSFLLGPEASLQFSISIIRSLDPEKAKYVPEGHRELFYIKGHLNLIDKGGLSFSLAVRINNKSEYYVLYQENQQFFKKFAEFFVSRQGVFSKFLPHSQDSSTEDTIIVEEINLLKVLDPYIELGIICFETFIKDELKCNSVVIPIGMEFKQDLFFENNLSFSKQFICNPMLSLLNSLNALKLINHVENQQLLFETLANLAAAQLEDLLSKNFNPSSDLRLLGEKVLVDIIPG